MGQLRNNFGNRMRQLRKVGRMTQEGLAERANLEPAYVGDVERGNRNLTIDNIEKIAKGLDLEAYNLFLFHDKEITAKPEISRETLIDIIDSLPKGNKEKILQILHLCSQLQS